MKTEILNTTEESLTRFKDLEAGDFFVYRGMVFKKFAFGAEHYGVGLGDLSLTKFADAVVVEPIKKFEYKVVA